MSSSLIRATALVAFASICVNAHGQQRPVNDTGVISCTNEAWGAVSCESVNATLPGQDAVYGRDALSIVGGNLNKVGTGRRGFDFTKIRLDGAVAAATATFGSGAGQYQCFRDNTTGLLWDAAAGNRSWRDPNPSTNGGFVGVEVAGNTTDVYIVETNTSNRCDRANWRLPTVREILSLMSLEVATAVWWADISFIGGYPGGGADNLPSAYGVWTSQTNPAYPEHAFVVVPSKPGACLPYYPYSCSGNNPNAVVRKEEGSTNKSTAKFTILVSSQ